MLWMLSKVTSYFESNKLNIQGSDLPQRLCPSNARQHLQAHQPQRRLQLLLLLRLLTLARPLVAVCACC
jgi:hypothetical protein